MSTRKKPDAMDELATKILRTNHPLVLDNIVWLHDAIAEALRAVERRERRRCRALLRERADAACKAKDMVERRFLGHTGDPIGRAESDAIRAAVLKGGKRK